MKLRDFKYYILGIISSLAVILIFPVEASNMKSLIAGGSSMARVSKDCDSSGDRCVYVRVEYGLSFSSTDITNIYPRRYAANQGSLLVDRIDCGYFADVTLEWDEALTIKSTYDDCKMVGEGSSFEFDINFARK